MNASKLQNDNSFKILVLGNNPETLEVFDGQFGEHDIEVIYTITSPEASIILSKTNLPGEKSIDLVVIDLSIPSDDGIDALTFIESDLSKSDTSVLILTTKDTVGENEFTFFKGLYDRILIPYKKQELINRVMFLLRTHRGAQILGQRMEELEHMHKAIEALAKVTKLDKVLEQITKSAQVVLHANAAAVWPYNNLKNRFLPELAVSSGLLAHVWKDLANNEPRLVGTTSIIMEEEWIGVENINDTKQYEFISETSRKLLNKIGLQSFQGIALKAEKENLGVLFVNYSHPRRFTEKEKIIAKTFANHATLALKKAGL